MISQNIGFAGNKGEGTRSDCFVQIELQDSGGLKIEFQSKVNSLFGNALKQQINEFAAFFNITNAKIDLIDFGALPFTISARLEAAFKKINSAEGKNFIHSETFRIGQTEKLRLRRSRLYIPGNDPKFFPNASLHKPDGIILDLEDSVHPEHKMDARFLVRNAFASIDFLPCERMVRINQGELGMSDLEAIIPQNVNVVLIPKCESADTVKLVDAKIESIATAANLSFKPWLMPIIESALGMENAFEIAKASTQICALAIGLEDYTADIGVERTNSGSESLYARARLINAAKAAGIQAIDTVFSDVSDMEALLKSTEEAKSLGFEGKGCIHPRQVKVINNAFLPKESEIATATGIVRAFEEAERNGKSVVSLGSKMIDPPVIKRAVKIVSTAEKHQLLNKNWREQ